MGGESQWRAQGFPGLVVQEGSALFDIGLSRRLAIAVIGAVRDLKEHF